MRPLNPFILLCGIGLLAIFSSTISKSPVLPLFASYLGADPSKVGLISSISAFTGIIASIPAGILSDKIGRRKMLFFSLGIFSTAPFLYLKVTNIWHLALVRFYHGLATALFIPIAMALVAELFPKQKGEKIGWFSTATLTGRFMSPLIGGGIIGALEYNPSLSYKIVYLVCGVAGLIALLLAFKIPSAIEKREKKMEWKETFVAFRGVLSNRFILLTAAVEASILFAYGTFETFLPLYCLEQGLSAYEVGFFLSSQVITLALTKPMMGRFSDLHGREPQIFWGALFGALCIGGFYFFGSFLPLLVLSICFGLSISIVTSATSAFIADLSKKESYGSAMGLLGSIMDIGHTTGPLVSGIVALYLGLSKAFVGAAFVLIAAAISFLFLVFLVKGKTN